MPLFPLTYQASPTTFQPSLRADATGAAILYIGAARTQKLFAPILYDQGFTGEYAIKPTDIGARSVAGGDSRIVPCVHSHVNTATSIFNLGFDNWANPGVATDLLPAFSILSDSQNYQVINDRGAFLGEARGTKVMVLDDTYHLLGTLDVNGLCQIYVNGVLEDTAVPNINMVVFLSTLNEFLGNAGRTLRNDLIVGTRFLDGAYRGSSATGRAIIDNIRFYPQHFSAVEAAAAASQIAFTP